MSRGASTAVIAWLAITVSLSAQSLGDLAKKTAADRDKAKTSASESKDAKDAKPAAKVYTDQDLKTLPPRVDDSTGSGTTPPAVAPPASAIENAAPTRSSDTPTIDAAKRDEAYWRGRMRPLVERLLADVAEGGPIAARLSELRAKVEPNLASLAVFGPEITRLNTQLQQINARCDADQAAIDALKEEGRQAGALPGWFR